MNSNTKFKVSVFPENNPHNDIKPFMETFSSCREAFNYLIGKFDEMLDIIRSHPNDCDVSKGRPEWTFEILDKESMHKRMFVFSYDGLHYICDDNDKDIDPSDDYYIEDIFGVLFGYLKALDYID